jgi:hypothetical protein
VLTNLLPEAVSLVVPGQPFNAAPVRRPDGRIVSMTPEAAPGGTATYTFGNLKPGTFLYESGTHQAVHVQMGLYGALTLDAAAATAYPGVPYDHDVVLVYSEVDAALHRAVAGGTTASRRSAAPPARSATRPRCSWSTASRTRAISAPRCRPASPASGRCSAC